MSSTVLHPQFLNLSLLWSAVSAARRAFVSRYPIPRIEDLLAKLAGGKRFSKLDMSQAYQQLLLDESSRQYVVINTHKGLFCYSRLPFGVSSAPGIFQRVMENLLQDIPGVVVYIDDVLITGPDESGHMVALEEVLRRTEQAGLRLSKGKCWFMASSVEYLGYKINAEGLHPLPEKVRAIEKAPNSRPTLDSSRTMAVFCLICPLFYLPSTGC